MSATGGHEPLDVDCIEIRDEFAFRRRRHEPPLRVRPGPRGHLRLSATLVAEATDVSALPPALATLAYRLCTRAACPTSWAILRWHGTACRRRRRRAPRRRMRACGTARWCPTASLRSRLPAANTVLCYLNDPRTRTIQQRDRTTRSAAAVELWRGTTARIGHRHWQRADRALSASGDADRHAGVATGGDSRLSGRLRGRRGIETRTGGSRARHSFRHPARSPRRKRHGRGGGERSLRSPGPMSPWLTVVGMGDDGPDGLAPAARAVVERAPVVVGGPASPRPCWGRESASASPGRSRSAPWTKPSNGCAAGQSACWRRGTRPCYGVGSILVDRFGLEAVRIVPAPSALQPGLRAARLGGASRADPEPARPAAGAGCIPSFSPASGCSR